MQTHKHLLWLFLVIHLHPPARLDSVVCFLPIISALPTDAFRPSYYVSFTITSPYYQ